MIDGFTEGIHLYQVLFFGFSEELTYRPAPLSQDQLDTNMTKVFMNSSKINFAEAARLFMSTKHYKRMGDFFLGRASL